MSDSQYEGNSAPSIMSPVVNKKDEASALFSLHWYDTNGWVARSTSGHIPLIPSISLLEQVEEDPNGNQLTHIHLENGHW